MEDDDVEGSHSATTFSNKLASLLSFLDDLQNTDSCNELSSNYDGREMFGVTSSHVACTGPAVIKNSANTARLGEEEERDKDLHDCVVPSTKTSSSSKSLLTREKIYIWDEWEETVQDGAMVLLDIDRHMAPGYDPKEYTKSNLMPADARQQLQLLKAMSEEVQTRASSMKIELDYKTKKVEELHALRVKTESDHVQRMKSMKQEWKTRLEDAKAERDEVANEQEKMREALALGISSLEKQASSLDAEITKATTSEREMCERLKGEGVRELENAKKSWQQAEKDELKKRDQKISLKLKQDAAKKIEPKLRELIENHKEEAERLQREANRELDYYILNLYKCSNEEYRKETNKIRDNEERRMSHLENELRAKLESCRIEQENEMKKIREEYDQRADMMKRQFSADKQKFAEEHQINLIDAQKAEDLEMEHARVQHLKEMVDMEEEYTEQMAQKQKAIKEEFNQWKLQWERKQQSEEESKLKDEGDNMKQKVQSDIDLVKRKINEEWTEKKKEEQTRLVERSAVIEDDHYAEVQSLEEQLEQCTLESDTLMRKEVEESRSVGELQNKVSDLLEILHTREDASMMEARRLSSYVEECDEQIAENCKAGDRRIAQMKNEKSSLEVEFDKLVANRPKQMEQMAKAIDDLRAKNGGEMKLAESKVHAMLESKKSVVEGASAQLLKLRNDTSNIERELDEARKKKLLQPVIDHKERAREEAREDTSKPKVGKTRIQQSITRISKSLSKR